MWKSNFICLYWLLRGKKEHLSLVYSLWYWSVSSRSLFHFHHCELTWFWKLTLQKYLRVGGRDGRRGSRFERSDPGRALSLPSFLPCLPIFPFSCPKFFEISQNLCNSSWQRFHTESGKPMSSGEDTSEECRAVSRELLYMSSSSCEHFLFHFGARPHVPFIVQLVLQ